MKAYQERNKGEMMLSANRRRLQFELKEVMYDILNTARSDMESEFVEQFEATGIPANWADDRDALRRYLRGAAMKVLSPGGTVQGEIAD